SPLREETISSFCEWRAATVVWGWACRRAHCDWDDSCAGGWGSPRAHGLCCSVACLLVGVEAVSAAGRIHPGGSLYAAYRCRRSGRTASSYPMALGVLGVHVPEPRSRQANRRDGACQALGFRPHAYATRLFSSTPPHL